MRLTLYDALLARLACVRTVDGIPAYIREQSANSGAEKPPQAIKTFDLWNEQVERLKEQRPFGVPAVFVEFRPIVWGQSGNGSKYADVEVRLHILTATLATPNSPYKDAALYRLHLIRAIEQAFVGFAGVTKDKTRSFGTFVHLESESDHNHGEVREDIETWKTRCYDRSMVGYNLVETPQKVTLDDGDVFVFVFGEQFT